MSRSPIEIMVDQACGFNLNLEASKKRDEIILERNAEILLSVADAAKFWYLANADKNRDELKIDDAEEKLNVAIEKWIEIGG